MTRIRTRPGRPPHRHVAKVEIPTSPGPPDHRAHRHVPVSWSNRPHRSGVGGHGPIALTICGWILHELERGVGFIGGGE